MDQQLALQFGIGSAAMKIEKTLAAGIFVDANKEGFFAVGGLGKGLGVAKALVLEVELTNTESGEGSASRLEEMAAFHGGEGRRKRYGEKVKSKK
jgi:hypothetical protein